VATAVDDSKPAVSPETTASTLHVRWQLNGIDHADVLGWDYAVKAGDPLEIWVDVDGNRVDRPTPVQRAAADALTAAIVGWLIAVLAAAQVVLTVLDVAADSQGAWATRVGGTFAISTAPHAVTQRWARHIVEAFPALDGLRYNSRFAGQPCMALFLPAASAMPRRPLVWLPLTHPATASRIAGSAKRLGYGVV